MSIKYYKDLQRRFEWKYEAKCFVAELKRKAKVAKLKIVVKVMPEYHSISGRGFSESRIEGYWVRWYYKPPRNVK